MNIFMREMLAYRKSLFFWSLGSILLVVLGMVKYAGLSSSSQSMNELMSQLPEAIKVISGVGTFDLSTASGYYGVLFLYIILMGTIHAVMLGTTIIAKEERDKTAEFLFVKPISRHKIMTAKVAAAFVNILVFNVVTYVSSIVSVAYFSKGEDIGNDILLLMIGMFVLQVLFLCLGLGISALTKKEKTGTAIGTSVLLGTFMLSMAIDMNEKLDVLKYVTPFKYFEAKNIMDDQGFDLVFVSLSLLIIVISLGTMYTFYSKKDLNN